MNIMSVDAEYAQPSRKCIQIGAAAYDATTAECLGTFETYVNPGEPISEEIIALTGITDKDVENAPKISEAFDMLKAFHKKHKCFRNPLLWGSGVRNDSHSLWLESGSTEENFMGFRVIDAKTLYQSAMLFGNGEYAGGLEKSMNKLGLVFEGKAHTALTDAKNTFTIWYYLTRKLHDGIKIKK
jgi:inhibitor of KinA sporulation pathway (predicted exonuclease)